MNVVNNTDRNRFEVTTDGKRAVAEYILSKTRIIFTHTEVPDSLEGQGIGTTLARAGLDYARTNSLRVMPLCPFIAAFIENNPEYKDLLMPGFKIKTK